MEWKVWRLCVMKDTPYWIKLRTTVHEIPADTSPKCPKLRTLILKHNESLTLVFHRHWNFAKICVSLEYPHCLFLTSCKQLRCMPSLTKLQDLIRLDLSFTAIHKYPKVWKCWSTLNGVISMQKNLMPAGKEIAESSNLEFLILHWWSRKMKVKVEHISSL